MNYQQLTVYNYKISYFLFRVFTLFWLVEQYNFYQRILKRKTELYSPSNFLQQFILPTFPSELIFCSLIFITTCITIFSLYKQSVILNILLFIFTGIVSMPIAGYFGLSHTNHLLILFYFFSIFLLPKNLKTNDYKYVQYHYLGLLSTYTLAGFWKLVAMGLDFTKNNPKISWYETGAAKYNSIYNYFMIDKSIPSWMEYLYSYENLWVVLTTGGILMQTLSFLGAFNRKILNIVLLFLFTFHLYTKYFVIADLKIMKYGLLFIFFPYHYFKSTKFFNKSLFKFF